MTTSLPIDLSLGNARITFENDLLTATTGIIRRQWRWTGRGFLTTEVTMGSGGQWRLDQDDPRDADWLLPVVENENPEATLVCADARISDDEGFTSKHVSFVAEMTYPDALVALQFEIWAYPDAPGLRTQLRIKALDGYEWNAGLSSQETTEKSLRTARLSRNPQRQEILPVTFEGTTRHMIGYHAGTQNRNDHYLDLLLEAVDDRPITHPYTCHWASAMCVEGDSWGLAMVKESHKCINSDGVDGGLFVCKPGLGLVNYGWGIKPTDIDSQWRSGWANWCIAYESGDRTRQRAFKTFDGMRYPIGDRDVYVQANTWGSSQGGKEHRDAACEKNVLREIDSCADLGIDVLQIDDGWQGDQYDEWTPIPPRYPDGWATVRDRAKEAGVDLGLWMAAMPPSLEDMQRNVKDGDFVSLKLDFAVLRNRKQIAELMDKTRALVLSCDHKLRVNWDLTEACPRYGYFYAREFGCIYLENRKPVIPHGVTYRPGTVLRDLWDLSAYCNLLKFQGSVQNVDMVNPELSDVGAYSQAYCTAIPLMSSPLFFCETHFFEEPARTEIRTLLAAYKTVRDEIYQGTVYPIGQKPDGTNWTGFECQLTERTKGYLMVFREPWNTEETHSYSLPDLAGKTLEITDLMRKTSWTTTVDESGDLVLTIDDPGDFRFLSYTCKNV